MTQSSSPIWDLSELSPSDTDPSLDRRLSMALTKANDFATTYRGRVASLSAHELAIALDAYDQLLHDFYVVSQYAHLRQSVDTQDDGVKALVDRVETDGATLSNELVFFQLEVGQASDAIHQQWLADTALSTRRYQVALLIKTAPYQLTEPEEKWIALKDITGVNAMTNMVNEWVSSFEYEWETNGKVDRLNGSQLRALRHDPDPSVRARAMTLYLNRVAEQSVVLGGAFKSIIKDFNIERQARGFKTPRSVKLMGADLDEEMVAMIERVTVASYGLVQRYYRIKRQLLGLPVLTLADLYAPLPQASDRYTWDEAVALVLDSMKAFDTTFYDMAKRVIDRRRIDARVHPTKQGGAYCSSSVPGIDPFVMTNFLGRSRDVATLAHELGHAIHAMCCAHHPLAYYHPILPLCETASVFAEMLVTDRLLAQASSVSAKQAILCEKLEDIFATSHRQNLFSRFEQQVHEICSTRLPATRELCDLYRQELAMMFGDAVDIPDHYQWEWLSIPHLMESPFYVYSYNVGNLLVMSLYHQYKRQGPSFVGPYRDFLSAGSSMSPVAIGQLAGVTMTDESFWQQGIDAIGQLVSELEATMTVSHA